MNIYIYLTYIIFMYDSSAVRPSVHPSVHPSVRPSDKNGPTLRYSFEAPRRDTDLKLVSIDYLGEKKVRPRGQREISS